MPRRREEILACRDQECEDAEKLLAEASAAAVQRFLARVRDAVGFGLRRVGIDPDDDRPSLRAAGAPEGLPGVSFELFSSGQARGWWAESVGDEIEPAVTAAWRRGFDNESTLSTGLDGVPTYLAKVRDRLSPNIGPSLPQDAFDMARTTLARELATGSSPRELSRELAATFSWDKDAEHWRTAKAQVDQRIDALLDPLGPPGDPAREKFKRTNEQIKALQAERNIAQSHIDSVETTWQARATRIARTESTGALNAGALAAYGAEGVACVEWGSTLDARTRPSHVAADGQRVPFGKPFSVGGKSLSFPGDPSGPAHLVINCRCFTVSCELSDLDPADRSGAPKAAPPALAAVPSSPLAEIAISAALRAAVRKFGNDDKVPGSDKGYIATMRQAMRDIEEGDPPTNAALATEAGALLDAIENAPPAPGELRRGIAEPRTTAQVLAKYGPGEGVDWNVQSTTLDDSGEITADFIETGRRRLLAAGARTVTGVEFRIERADHAFDISELVDIEHRKQREYLLRGRYRVIDSSVREADGVVVVRMEPAVPVDTVPTGMRD